MKTALIRKQRSRASARSPRKRPASPVAPATGPGQPPTEPLPHGVRTAAQMTPGAGPTSSVLMKKMASYLWTTLKARPEPICRAPSLMPTPTPSKHEITADWSQGTGGSGSWCSEANWRCTRPLTGRTMHTQLRSPHWVSPRTTAESSLVTVGAACSAGLWVTSPAALLLTTGWRMKVVTAVPAAPCAFPSQKDGTIAGTVGSSSVRSAVDFSQKSSAWKSHPLCESARTVTIAYSTREGRKTGFETAETEGALWVPSQRRVHWSSLHLHSSSYWGSLDHGSEAGDWQALAVSSARWTREPESPIACAPTVFPASHFYRAIHPYLEKSTKTLKKGL